MEGGKGGEGDSASGWASSRVGARGSAGLVSTVPSARAHTGWSQKLAGAGGTAGTGSCRSRGSGAPSLPPARSWLRRGARATDPSGRAPFRRPVSRRPELRSQAWRAQPARLACKAARRPEVQQGHACVGRSPRTMGSTNQAPRERRPPPLLTAPLRLPRVRLRASPLSFPADAQTLTDS